MEEAYEVLAALDAENQDSLLEELGDLLLQIVLHAQIASELGEFTMAGILKTIHEKLVRRHPHVFGDLVITDARKVIENWERLKSVEREHLGKSTSGILDGVDLALPALFQAETYQNKVAAVGFDWTEIGPVKDKITEELREVDAATTDDEREVELGDLLFSVVNLARWLEIDAESSLRRASARFRERFMRLEESVRRQGKQVGDLPVDELDSLWSLADKNR
jgi:tetrapyrrole methylase family protein/MazG family protein